MIKGNKVFAQIEKLTTEQRNPQTLKIDSLSVKGILSLINAQDKMVAVAVQKEITNICRAVELVIKALKCGGRLIYIGAGTSGRLGVLDAVECPPTFGTNPKMIQGIIAGGKKAMFKAIEGAEDNEINAVKDIDRKKVAKNDVVCGIAASLRTPYVGSAIRRAKKRGASTIFITTNSKAFLRKKKFLKLAKAIDVAICIDVGPEVIMGSTRMKSGTAQKLVLNMITTTAMIKLGKVYENMMVDLKASNSKLRERAKRIVMIATGITYKEAEKYLIKSNYHVKTAIVMIKAGVNLNEAKLRLQKSQGFVRNAIKHKNAKNR